MKGHFLNLAVMGRLTVSQIVCQKTTSSSPGAKPGAGFRAETKILIQHSVLATCK